ncbi:hypothetical protein [Beijerinckia indica]|uniref:DUF2188 domain-containing protein n=1 Tax=Beijerinckia indica subsp. indica (strain ATCC 9039 / DSM 1715 / NCIMB 8712) TaxID=395963 RepID=B2IL15_BEII9|nr:hypothetical protein [Beijerinckia indica]ACB96555.1 hypothetical protein Bind_2991 [Beijerinckia indica subsp. indica ATCC 9039]
MQTVESHGQIIYLIRGCEANWHVEINNQPGMSYASKEAAFEVAVAAASNAIRDGQEVVIVVPGSKMGERALGIYDQNTYRSFFT